MTCHYNHDSHFIQIFPSFSHNLLVQNVVSKSENFMQKALGDSHTGKPKRLLTVVTLFIGN